MLIFILMFKFSIPESKTSFMLMQSVFYNIIINLTEFGFRELIVAVVKIDWNQDISLFKM